ncbi:MAG: alanine racemase [bacterium]|nr:alanine racemase [bacterium]
MKHRSNPSLHRGLRTWIELDREAVRHNVQVMRGLLGRKTRLMAVVKSNAYGHGLSTFSKLLDGQGLPGQGVYGFCVDSVLEGFRLRKEGITKPILILGSTLPEHFSAAAESDIALTISTFEGFEAFLRVAKKPAIHIKIDTGMHRQGFFPAEISKLLKLLKRSKLAPSGAYTHFAAKDWGYPVYTELQFAQFKKALTVFERAGFKDLIRHAAASDATLLFPESHLDMVRVGMALYGYWPSWAAKVKHPPRMHLKPVLTWKTIVSEIKEIPAGSYVGYDLTERVSRKTKIAVLPIGYWHGYDRGLSSIGEVLIRGKRRRVLGRVSMDMTVVDVTAIPGVSIGDEVVMIGAQGKEAIGADEPALKIGTSHYEFLTRINPLIERIVA